MTERQFSHDNNVQPDGSTSSFSELVSVETLAMGGFEPEASMGLMNEGRLLTVYLGRVGGNSIAVIEKRLSVFPARREWFFGAFTGGTRDDDYDWTPEGMKEFDDNLRSVVAEEHRVDGSELEGKIRQVIEDNLRSK